ncbi:hypothetical protein ACFQMM_13430 [Saliphagus sp. GCM10025308]
MSSNLSLGTAKLLLALLVAIAVVLAAGLAVGQAPALFGVEEEPEASITFSDQTTNGSSVEVESVTLSDGGFIVITNSADETVAVSDRLDAAHTRTSRSNRTTRTAATSSGSSRRRSTRTRRTRGPTCSKRATARRTGRTSRTAILSATPRASP